VFLRRIGLRLTKIKAKIEEKGKYVEKAEFLFKYPILDYVEEISKIFIFNEFELIQWCFVLEHYLTKISYSKNIVES
jgi:hypothetical protein